MVRKHNAKTTQKCQKNFLIIALATIWFSISFSLSTPVFAESCSCCNPVKTALMSNCEVDGESAYCPSGGSNGIIDVIKIVITILSSLVGIAALTGIVIFGIQYLTAGGDVARATKAKKRMIEIVIGLAIYVVFPSILYWLMPDGSDVEIAEYCPTPASPSPSGPGSGGSTPASKAECNTTYGKYDSNSDPETFTDQFGHTYCIYKQTDPAWSGYTSKDGLKTVEKCGCAVTSIAIANSGYGLYRSMAELKTYFEKHVCGTNLKNDLVNITDAKDIWGNSKTGLFGKARDILKNGGTVVIRQKPSHWITLLDIKCDNDNKCSVFVGDSHYKSNWRDLSSIINNAEAEPDKDGNPNGAMAVFIPNQASSTPVSPSTPTTFSYIGSEDHPDDVYDYVINAPQNTKGLPLIIYLHGDGIYHKKGKEGTVIKSKITQTAKNRTDFVFAALDAGVNSSGSAMWNKSKIYKTIEYLIDKYDINRQRIYITGFSTGSSIAGSVIFSGTVPSGYFKALAFMANSSLSEGDGLKNFSNTKVRGYFTLGDTVCPSCMHGSLKILAKSGYTNVSAIIYDTEGHSWSWIEDVKESMIQAGVSTTITRANKETYKKYSNISGKVGCTKEYNNFPNSSPDHDCLGYIIDYDSVFNWLLSNK